MIMLAPEPPAQKIKTVREALANAQKVGAEEYAAAHYREAVQLYDSAMQNWSVQNSKFFLFRDYDSTLMFIEKALVKAAEAESYSISQTGSAREKARIGIRNLKKEAKTFEYVYKRLPLSKRTHSDYNKGKMSLAEAELAFDAGRYNESVVLLEKARKLIVSSGKNAETVLKAWFEHYSTWEKLGNEAVRLSRNGQKVILVDKYAHQCKVYQNRKVIRQYDAELGINWMGDKRYKGDKATPEGLYKITARKDGGRTKFHKALLINYPNDDDKRRFALEKKKGTISASKDIGGLIEIHGLGGKGINWTDGCIALKNEEMDELFGLVGIGTPVIIVGSLKPLKDILTR